MWIYFRPSRGTQRAASTSSARQLHHGEPSPAGPWDGEAVTTWIVMGGKERVAHSSSGLTLFSVLVVFAMLISIVSSDCKLKRCSDQYSPRLTERASRKSRRYCQALVDYRKCVMDIPPKSCRGELSYHSTLTIIPDLMETHNCEEVLSRAKVEPPQKTAPPRKTPKRSHDRCNYHGEQTFKSCSLFGDPHLRTFDASFQTCRVAGAWPVFYNKYVAAQVTNVQLLHGAGATATTKLSIIVKEHRPCAERKLYLAQTGKLPGTFVDGSHNSGPRGMGVVITEVMPGKHVEIHIRYIGTVIIIRQIGEYLLFSVRMPEEIIKRHGPEDLQLCVHGCPGGERIDYVEFLKRSHGVDKTKIQRAVDKCRQTNVIDVYLDSCVFDLLTTGDDNFTNAAESAFIDISRLQPNSSLSLHNRTSLFEDSKIWAALPVSDKNGAPPRTPPPSAMFHFAIVLLAFWVSNRLTTCYHVI